MVETRVETTYVACLETLAMTPMYLVCSRPRMVKVAWRALVHPRENPSIPHMNNLLE